MSDNLDDLIGNVQNTAEWRRRKAEQFPDDARNLQAAEELERLAVQIEELEESEVHKQINEATDSLVRACEASARYEVWTEINEAVSADLRSIGFHGSSDAVQFLEWYRDQLRERLLDESDKAVPAPDLSEQAANDPAVIAAKQAYDEAFAKAYAEARKKNA